MEEQRNVARGDSFSPGAGTGPEVSVSAGRLGGSGVGQQCYQGCPAHPMSATVSAEFHSSLMFSLCTALQFELLKRNVFPCTDVFLPLRDVPMGVIPQQSHHAQPRKEVAS